MKSPHTKTKPLAERTLAEEETTLHCLRAMSNTRPDRASFALGTAAPPQWRVMNSLKAATNLRSPKLLPKSLDELIFGHTIPTKGDLVQQFRFNPSKLRRTQQIVLASSLLSDKG